MTKEQLDDFKAWFNHSNWKPTDQLGEIGAIMLNQMPLLFDEVDALMSKQELLKEIRKDAEPTLTEVAVATALGILAAAGLYMVANEITQLLF